MDLGYVLKVESIKLTDGLDEWSEAKSKQAELKFNLLSKNLMCKQGRGG